nr:TonB box [Hymenolepis microstoma]
MINETYEVKPDPDFLSFKLDAVHPVRLQECQNFIVANPKCPSRGSMHIKCRFTSRLFYAQLIQLRPLDWGKFQIKLESRERISYHHIEGYFEGTMAACCKATMKGEPLIFPYISKVYVDKVSRCIMTQDSNLRLPGSIEPNGLKNYLRGLLNSYFRIYLTEHLYEPPC